ncbi:hypothetical protein [Paracoccus sp. (in: a-proteobacteria)]|uniref:hypothetical protein n=1 Tax=Paracoccus sp. TaxID=267 RepID=UPI00272CF870|nr:hypothetical protein [Paracoccus sp. (in: a-proteobacteria)]
MANEDILKRTLSDSGDLKGASLGTRILVNRLRVELRANPTTLSAKLAELKDYIARNPAAAAELAQA